MTFRKCLFLYCSEVKIFDNVVLYLAVVNFFLFLYKILKCFKNYHRNVKFTRLAYFQLHIDFNYEKFLCTHVGRVTKS